MNITYTMLGGFLQVWCLQKALEMKIIFFEIFEFININFQKFQMIFEEDLMRKESVFARNCKIELLLFLWMNLGVK